MRYRKKPVEIEAFRYGIDPGPDWFMDGVRTNAIVTYTQRCYIRTMERMMICGKGDWVIRGIEGEMYPCKDSIFQAPYEPVEDEALNEVDDR